MITIASVVLIRLNTSCLKIESPRRVPITDRFHRQIVDMNSDKRTRGKQQFSSRTRLANFTNSVYRSVSSASAL